MMQRGELKEIHGSYYARYYADAKRMTKKLGRVSDFASDDDARLAFELFMRGVNTEGFTPEPTTVLRTFVAQKYFPSATTRLRGSTIKGYKAAWKHLEPRLGRMKVSTIRAVDVQRAMDSIVKANPSLKLATLTRVKSFAHEVFTETRLLGLRDDNPTTGVRINCSREARVKMETGAYSLDEIKAILNVLTGAMKVLIAVAAHTGLRRSEIIGLRWADYDGQTLRVRRNICFGERGEMSVEAPKTPASHAPVPVIKPLRLILDDWKSKAEVEEATGYSWVFPASFVRSEHDDSLLDDRHLTPLSPTNALRDVILPALGKAEIEWKGYHAFRRGLATNLRALGCDDLTISEIMRHSDVQITRRAYIKRVSQKSIEAMSRLEEAVALKKPVRGQPRNGYSIHKSL
jgi:integrase